MKKKNMKKLISILVAVMVLGFYYIFDTYQLGPTTDSTNKRVEEAVVTSNENLEVTFLDVGQADSILLECGSNNMLIDAGNNEDGEKIVSYLQEEGITDFSYVVGTHPHEDHSAHHVYPSQHGVCEQFLIPPGNACVPIVAEYS